MNNLKHNQAFKILALALCFCFFFEQTGLAQAANYEFNLASVFVATFSKTVPTTDKFRPLHLRYLNYDAVKNNFQLLLDRGDLKDPSTETIEGTTKTLMEYFYIGLRLPNSAFWVNLRPDSSDNIIDRYVSQTDIGKVLLEADVQLKKDTAAYTSPQTPIGKEYWGKLYKKAVEIFGTQEITIPTLTRPWIVPGEIILRESESGAYIYKATLKVMLEQDYLQGTGDRVLGTGSVDYTFKDPRLKELNEYSSQLIRELIIPILNKEVNSSRKYSALRQVYYSLILAQWFKQKQGLSPQGNVPNFIDSRNLAGLTSETPWNKDTYYQQYRKSFRDGEYNVKEPVSTAFGQVIRTYMSGGTELGHIMENVKRIALPGKASFALADLKTNLPPIKIDVNGNIEAAAGPASSPVEADNSRKEQEEQYRRDAYGRRSKLTDKLYRIQEEIEKNKLPVSNKALNKFVAELEILFKKADGLLKLKGIQNERSHLVSLHYTFESVVNNIGKAPGNNEQVTRFLLSRFILFMFSYVDNPVLRGDKEQEVNLDNWIGQLYSATDDFALMLKSDTEMRNLTAPSLGSISETPVQPAEIYQAIEDKTEILAKDIDHWNISLDKLTVFIDEMAILFKEAKEFPGMEKHGYSIDGLVDGLREGERDDINQARLINPRASAKELFPELPEMLFYIRVLGLVVLDNLKDAGNKQFDKTARNWLLRVNAAIDRFFPQLQNAVTTKNIARSGMDNNGLSGPASSPVRTGLPEEQAMIQINDFLGAIQKGIYQKGAIVDLSNLPQDKKTILVGDLHARLDNLKKILNKNNNLERIERGEVVLVILGDAVHSETNLTEMASSIEIMQFIMDLKIQNPDNVYYILGNHDYLSDRPLNGGVFQGTNYREAMNYLYGEDYIMRYEEFIKMSPLMVIGNGFIGLHAGPIKNASIVDVKEVDVADERNPIVRQAEWGRYQETYNDEDVKEFLNGMGQSSAQFIVAHSPRRDGDWHWELLHNHHIIFAAHDRVGYALIDNGKVDFIEVTDESTKISEPGAASSPASSPIDEDSFQKKLAVFAGGLALSQEQRESINMDQYDNSRKDSEALKGAKERFNAEIAEHAQEYFWKDPPVTMKDKLKILRSFLEEPEWISEIPYILWLIYDFSLWEIVSKGDSYWLGLSGLDVPGEVRALEEILRAKDISVSLEDKEAFQEFFSGIGSSPVEKGQGNASLRSASIPLDENKGGIDFRSLPIVTQAVNNLSLNFRDSPLRGQSLKQSLSNVDLNKEIADIERMVNAGITPSTERIKEYLQISCIKGAPVDDLKKVFLCIAEILREQENECLDTDPALQDMLILIDAAKTPENLKTILMSV